MYGALVEQPFNELEHLLLEQNSVVVQPLHCTAFSQDQHTIKELVGFYFCSQMPTNNKNKPYAPLVQHSPVELEMTAKGEQSPKTAVSIPEEEPDFVDNRIEYIEDEPKPKPSPTKFEKPVFPMDEGRSHIQASNLDHFFRQVYKYFYEKGFWCLLLKRLVKLLYCIFFLLTNFRTVLFVIVSSTFLSILLNWKGLWTCNQQECKDVRVMQIPTHLSHYHITVLVFEGVFALYWLALFIMYVVEIGRMWSIKLFFENELKVSEVSS